VVTRATTVVRAATFAPVTPDDHPIGQGDGAGTRIASRLDRGSLTRMDTNREEPMKGIRALMAIIVFVSGTFGWATESRAIEAHEYVLVVDTVGASPTTVSGPAALEFEAEPRGEVVPIDFVIASNTREQLTLVARGDTCAWDGSGLPNPTIQIGSENACPSSVGTHDLTTTIENACGDRKDVMVSIEGIVGSKSMGGIVFTLSGGVSIETLVIGLAAARSTVCRDGYGHGTHVAGTITAAVGP
jgi:hypothetical protein